MSNADQAIARVAASQHGVFSRRQSDDAGFTRSARQHRVRSGRWIELQPGAYVIAGTPITWRTHLMAGCLSCDGVASHRSQATLLGIDGFRPGRPEITIERGRALVRPEISLHESKDVHEAQKVCVDGVPTLTPARLAMDLGGVVTYSRFTRAVDELLVRRLVTYEALLDALVAFAKRGRNGSAALRAFLADGMGSAVTDSMLEQTFLRGFGPRDLTAPTPQVEIYDTEGFIARVDFAFLDAMVAIELDGRRHHARSQAFELDPEKRNRLTKAGWHVLVYTWRRLIDRPNGVYAEVERTRRNALAAPTSAVPIIRVAGTTRLWVPPAA
jgi:hypothetical protein